MDPSSDAVAELDRLLLDDPYGDQIEGVMTVAGDLLQSRGELRGEQIVLEQALTHASDPQHRHARAATHERWLEDHEASVFGVLRELRRRPGALRCQFRGGRLRALCIDTRRIIEPDTGVHVTQLMQLVVGSPALRRITELRVRVRHEAEAAQALEAVTQAGRKLPLEVLLISPTTRPLGHQTRSHAVELRKHFPHLWLVTRYARLAPLLDPELPDQTTAVELCEFADAHMDQELRIRIGRGLSSGRELTTKVACELIAGLGASARVFAPTIALLLRPKVSHAAAWILPALPSFGAWVHELVPQVRRITGSAATYPVELRRLAGQCLHALSSAQAVA